MATITIVDGNGVKQTIQAPNTNGQATATNSAPVVLASDQTAIPVTAVSLPLPTGAATAAGVAAVVTALGTPMQQTGGSVSITGTPSVAQSGTWNIANVTGTVSLPTGASTAANQATIVTNTATIATNTGRLASAAASTAVSSTFTASGNSANFTPDLSRAIWVRLSGTWSGTVVLQRSTDGGTTWYGLTTGSGTTKGSWTVNVNAPITEETVSGAIYRLAATWSSGTISYEIRQ